MRLHGLLPSGVLCLVLLVPSSPVEAHRLKTPPAREVIRLQGFRAAPDPSKGVADRLMTLVVMGEPLSFHVSEWLRIDISGAGPEERAPTTLLLQGPPETLFRLRNACADQRVTILAERRRGSSEAFVLALDLCPPQSPPGGCPVVKTQDQSP